MWYRADEHGLEHDGLHGEGTLTLRLEWRLDEEDEKSMCYALVSVVPWLAYGCG